jgi:hypothetical protein
VEASAGRTDIPGAWTVPDPGTDMELICFFPHPDLDDNIEELEDMIVSADRGEIENG